MFGSMDHIEFHPAEEQGMFKVNGNKRPAGINEGKVIGNKRVNTK
jgi:hypothetical protein